MLITKEALESMGLSKDSTPAEIIWFPLKADNLRKLGPEYTHIADEQERYENSRKTCSNCKNSLEEHGHVCDSHFHDYVLFCGNTHCKRCYLYESWIKAFHNIDEYVVEHGF